MELIDMFHHLVRSDQAFTNWTFTVLADKMSVIPATAGI